MQRTVKGIRVTLAKVEINNGHLEMTDNVIMTFTNTDETTAIKRAQKKYNGYGVVSCTPFEQLYVLDDEIFFKYATPVNTATNEVEK